MFTLLQENTLLSFELLTHGHSMFTWVHDILTWETPATNRKPNEISVDYLSGF